MYLREAKARNYIAKTAEQPAMGGVVRVMVIGGLTFKGRQVLKNPTQLNLNSENQPAAIDMSTTIHQTISGIVHGSVVAAKHIENSFNSLPASKADDAVKGLLEQLLAEIKTLNDKVPPTQAQQLTDMAEEKARKL